MITSAQSKNIKNLRIKGLTHRQIAKRLRLSVGSVFNHSKGILLTPEIHLSIKRNNYLNSLNKLSNEQKFFNAQKGGMTSSSKFVPKYNSPQLIKLLKDFYDNNLRIPTKRDFQSSYRAFLRVFGSWNNAIRSAGIPENPVLFSKKYIANDGHKCDSLSEKIIDDWLKTRKVDHQKNIRYPNSKFTADFLVNNVYIEFFGLSGELESYDLLKEKKLLLIKNHKLDLIPIYPEDLFPKSRLDIILISLIK